MSTRIEKTNYNFAQYKNLGLSTTRNIAIDSMTGQFVMWVDSDDFIEPDMVEKLIIAQSSNDADIVTCNVVVDMPKM